jgi:hypothetical protein
MTEKVVGVHGVGNDPSRNSAASLSAAWTSHLRCGFAAALPDFEVSVAFYAPVLRVPRAQGNLDPDLLDPEVQALIRSWLRNFPAPAAIAQGRGTRPLRAALEWIGHHYGLNARLVQRFITRFFREVAYYFDPAHAGHRQAAQQVVLDTITAHQARVVIAHSLGSIVAYEALWAQPPPQIDLLLTLGSPLAMPDVVYHRLLPSPTTPPGRPPTVRRWVNLADPGDLVAVPRLLSRYFAGIDTDLEPSIHVLDFHTAKNYLANPTTAAILQPHL